MENALLAGIAQALRRRGFEADVVATTAEAAELVDKEAEGVSNVGWGGSETLRQAGIKDRMAALGKEIRDHRLDCDLFLLSANAITEDGVIVNIDGNGNRVAASICGPRRVVYVIGRNKVVRGGVEDAIARIKRCACPPNARRLGKKTPCGIGGVCTDCDSPDRMCKVTAVFDRRPTGMPTRVILVDQDLGY